MSASGYCFVLSTFRVQGVFDYVVPSTSLHRGHFYYPSVLKTDVLCFVVPLLDLGVSSRVLCFLIGTPSRFSHHSFSVVRVGARLMGCRGPSPQNHVARK